MCVPQDILDGGTFINGSVINGTLTNTNMTGGVVLDSATAQNIADALAPLLDGKVVGTADADEIRDIILELLLTSECNPLSAVLRTKLDARIVAMFEERLKNREGNPLSPGTQLMSAQEIAEAIAAAMDAFQPPDDVDADKITGVNLSPSGILTIQTQMVDGTFSSFQVDLSDAFDDSEIIVTAPLGTTTATGLPLSVYGVSNALVAAPVAWGQVTINGVNYRIPLYQG